MKSVELKHGVIRGLILALVCCVIFQSAPVGAQEGTLSELEEDRLQEEQEAQQDAQQVTEQAAPEAFSATLWTVANAIGIGTETPTGKFHIVGREATASTGSIVITEPANASQRLTMDANELNAATNLYINPNTGADVGIGIFNSQTSSLPLGNLHVIGREASTSTGTLVLQERTDPAHKMFLDGNEINTAGNLYLNYDHPQDVYVAGGNSRVGIGTTSPASKLHVKGTTTTDILQITGGDLAEPFEMIDAEVAQPGMVVAIDPENPGRLRVADAAYDRTVAGVVSGAGGIDAGLILYREEAAKENAHLVALTGRVYVWADASSGAIEPGDLLTTSGTPGHAMKVTDSARAQGAILGKAMSALDEGTGLVLVLVALQ